MFKYDTILCPVDFSEISKEALKNAVDLGKTFNSGITLLHVVEPIMAPTDFTFGPLTSGEVEEKLVARAKESLENLASTLGLASGKGKLIVARGRASAEIVRVAYDIDADLIVMGTHGYTGMVHVLIGSTAERVLRKSPCPVLTFRTSGKETESSTGT